MSEHLTNDDMYYTFEGSHAMNVSEDNINDIDNNYEILFCQIKNDSIALQLKAEKRNRLVVQEFPPIMDLSLFQPDLKQDGEVVFADDLTVFIYFPFKESLEVLQDRAKIGSMKGKLKNKKVMKNESNGSYLMVIDERLIQVNINIVTLAAEAIPKQLPFSKIYDFCHKDDTLYVIGIIPNTPGISIYRDMTGAFPVTFSILLSRGKEKFLKADRDNFVVYNKKRVCYLTKKNDAEIEVKKQVLIPLTASGLIMKALILEDGAIIIQDNSKGVCIFSDTGKELLLQDKPVLGNLVECKEGMYLAGLDDGIVQFYKLQKISLVNYAKQFNTFAELRPMKKFWLFNSETKDLFYEAYLKDHIDDILDLKEVMEKIKNIQLKIKLLQTLAPLKYQKLEEYLSLLDKEIKSNPATPSALSKVIEENKKQVSLYMKLNNNKFSKEGYANYKQKNILALISEYINNTKLVGMICSAYVKETISNYDKIIEKVIEYELEEAPKGELCIEKLLPLGKKCNERIDSGELGTFTGYWKGVRDQIRMKGFIDYSKDHNNYFKVIRLCLTRFKKSMSTNLLKHICIIIDCGRKREVENLDLLYFDFNLRAGINLLPDDDYNIEQTSKSCSERTFASFITRHGKDNVKIIKGIDEYYGQLIKYIEYETIATKEFFKLLERYMLHSEINYFAEIIAELNQIRGNLKDPKKYNFLYDNKPNIFNIALKHIYTQETVKHTQHTKEFIKVLDVFLAETRSQYKESFGMLEKHIEIAAIFKRYGFKQYTFKEICRLSNLPEWKTYVEFISKLIDEEITLADRLLLVSLQKKIISFYCSNTAKQAGIFNRDSWKECLKDVTRLSVTLYNST